MFKYCICRNNNDNRKYILIFNCKNKYENTRQHHITGLFTLRPSMAGLASIRLGRLRLPLTALTPPYFAGSGRAPSA